MIRLTEIKKNGEDIVCEAYVEGCKKPVSLKLNINEQSFLPYTLPKGYEWCHSYIEKAKWYLLSTDRLPREHTLMWF